MEWPVQEEKREEGGVGRKRKQVTARYPNYIYYIHLKLIVVICCVFFDGSLAGLGGNEVKSQTGAHSCNI